MLFRVKNFTISPGPQYINLIVRRFDVSDNYQHCHELNKNAFIIRRTYFALLSANILFLLSILSTLLPIQRGNIILFI